MYVDNGTDFYVSVHDPFDKIDIYKDKVQLVPEK